MLTYLPKLKWTVVFFLIFTKVFAGGAPSTYFNIYLPPNNDAVKRNVALIVTAIDNDTSFTIEDDGADGDTDDSVSGLLNSGQSYILYIKDNGINDDALYASGGVLKRDGDYLIIKSNKLIFASMSTDSDWQHDFVPSVNKTSLGNKFIIYAPKVSSSNRDLNIFAFEDETTFTISKISTVPTTQTGYTNINLNNKTTVRQRTINKGEDIIYFYKDGRDIMETGATYMIETNKNVSVQYGALWTNTRDGGGYVPSSNGSSSGELFYFSVPYDYSGEQEIRVVSWSDANNVILERYNNGIWTQMATWNLNRLKPADWIGKNNGNTTYATVFRVRCDTGKKISIFECNWMETGSPGTSDTASMVSSEDGTDAGKDFLVYLLPPGKQNNVINPFTGIFFNGNFSHCYLYAGKEGANVSIKDTKTGGQLINRSYTIEPYKYVDAYFSLDEWKKIYNNTGLASTGPDRPYILITSDKNISVMNANTNDNWMMYFGSSLIHAFEQDTTISKIYAKPGDIITLNSTLIQNNNKIQNPNIELEIESGITVNSSTATINNNNYIGIIESNQLNTNVTFKNIPDLNSDTTVAIATELTINPNYNNGLPIPNNTVISVTSSITGIVDGQIQQSIVTNGIQNHSSDLSNLIFTITQIENNFNTDTWNIAWVDYNNDGWEDIFITDKNKNNTNLLFANKQGKNFEKVTNNSLINNKEKTVAAVWGDYNNDGWTDVFIVNATDNSSKLYLNNQSIFTEVIDSGLPLHPEYFHGAAWFDYDNDGYLDLLITNYFETKFHKLYHNNKNGTFTKIENTPISKTSNRSTFPALADYNNDGWVDVFIPNGDNKKNSLFKNLGNGVFEEVKNNITSDHFNSVGAVWGDYNQDGHIDLFILNASKQANQLYKNLGNGDFEKVNSLAFLDNLADTHSANWLDHDNDGDLDLFIANDNGTSFYYIQQSEGVFIKKLGEVISSNFGKAMGSAIADYNKDGKIDLLVGTHSNQPNKLFKNQSNNQNSYLSIKLIGTTSNKSAIGCRIKISCNGKNQYRQILPVQGLGSQNSVIQHFGVGEATIVDKIEIIWPSGNHQTLNNVLADQLITVIEEDSNFIHGTTFNDLNQNGIFDHNEEPIAQIKLSINENSNTISNTNGMYACRLKTGNYEIKLANNEFWSMQAPILLNLTELNSTTEIHIPLQKINSETDLSINFGSTAWRRGFENETTLQIQNLSATTAKNIQVTFQLPNGLEIINADIPWNEREGNKYTWQIQDLAAGKELIIKMITKTNLTLKIGDTGIINATVLCDVNDIKVANNQYTETIEVVGAIDPNDILVSPKGFGKKGFIKKDQLLTYKIRFQNMGTYHASRIILKNQLNKNLNWNSLKIENVSHPNYQFQIDDKGLITVTFDKIELPPAEINELESHGFFSYTIEPKAQIAIGSEIKNNASIIFDFEDAINTNEVINTIYETSSLIKSNINIFPNPVTDEINIVSNSNITQNNLAFKTIEIYNSDGKLCETYENIDQEEVIHLKVNHLDTGIYFINATDQSGQIQQGRFIKN